MLFKLRIIKPVKVFGFNVNRNRSLENHTVWNARDLAFLLKELHANLIGHVCAKQGLKHQSKMAWMLLVQHFQQQ